MRIFNQEKTMQIHNPDLERGRLEDGRIQVGQTPEVMKVPEQGQYVVEREYPNGGKDMKWVVTAQGVQAKPSEPIYEDIQIYIPFTTEELEELRRQKFYEEHKPKFHELDDAYEVLRVTDRKIIQFVEGTVTASELELIKQQRNQARTTISRLEVVISELRQQAGV